MTFSLICHARWQSVAENRLAFRQRRLDTLSHNHCTHAAANIHVLPLRNVSATRRPRRALISALTACAFCSC